MSIILDRQHRDQPRFGETLYSPRRPDIYDQLRKYHRTCETGKGASLAVQIRS